MTMQQYETIVERVARAVLFRHGFQFCRNCSSIKLTTVEQQQLIILSIANKLSLQWYEITRKIQEEILLELLKSFDDIQILKDDETWQFRIHVV